MKIIPLLLLLSACSLDVDSESKTLEANNDDLSNASNTDGVSASAGSATNTDGVNAGENTSVAADDVSTDVGSSSNTVESSSALSNSVGSAVSSTDQTDQAGSDQSSVEPVNPDIINEISMPVGTPITTPESTETPETTESTESTESTETTETSDAIDAQVPVEIPESPTSSPIVRIPFTDQPNAPKIDGDTLEYLAGTELLDGEWRFAAQFNSANESLGINQYMFGEPGTDNDSANHHWAAIHDGVYLYVLVVSDDASKHYQDTNESRKPWKDDSVEIFIDGNHSRLSEYDGVDDYDMTINLLSSADISNSSYIADPKITPSDRSATLPSDLIFAAGPSKGPLAVDVSRGRKDIYEIRIKLSELNIQVGAPFGFEVQIHDDDNGGDRDAKWGWNHPEGNSSENDYTWVNPSFMGTAILLR